METRNVAITLEKAREWYKSNDSSLREVALQAFTKEELDPFDFTTIKTFKDACEVLGLNFTCNNYTINNINIFSKASAASFKLNIIRRALNKGHDMDLLEGKFWYPYNVFLSDNNTYIKYKCEKEVGRFVYKNKIYTMVGGFTDDSSWSGLGAFGSVCGVGHALAYVGFFGCATKEIAQHFGRYFAKEIFDAKYGDLIDYQWVA